MRLRSLGFAITLLLSFFHPSYILWFYYTTDGEAVALIEGALRVQGRRVEVQAPSAGIRVDLRLPVEAVATPIAENTAIPTEVPSAEEGERFPYSVILGLDPRIHIIIIKKNNYGFPIRSGMTFFGFYLSIFHPSYILWFYYTTDGETSTLIV